MWVAGSLSSCCQVRRSMMPRSLTVSPAPADTASWGGTPVITQETNTSSTSTCAKWPFFCSNLAQSMDCAPHTL